MSKQFVDFFKYKVERLFIRGPFYQLLFIAFTIASIAFISGHLLLWIESVPGGLPESSWWAFLRMSDPGYLGDDTGTAKRILSTILTVLGYVLFMGSLVAIMTQWLYRKMDQLEAGLTPIKVRGHICILGYTTRTPIILNEILSSEGRLRRFLKRNRQKRPQIAVLNPTIGYELTSDIKDHLDVKSHLNRIILRTGTPMKVEDLRRVNVEHSSTVIIPAVAFGEDRYEKSDMVVIKALLSIKHLIDKKSVPPPCVIAELLDEKKVGVAEKAYGKNIYVVSSYQFISLMIAQNVHHPGLSFVLAELLSQHYGNEVYLKKFDDLQPMSWGEFRSSFKDVIPIGFVNHSRNDQCMINPPADTQLENKDLFVFIANSYESIERTPKKSESVLSSVEPMQVPLKVEVDRKILILGWSEKVPRLVSELLGGAEGKTEIDVMAVPSIEERLENVTEGVASTVRDRVNHIVGDYAILSSLKKLDVTRYTNVILLASDWVNDSIEADARSVLGYLHLQECLGESHDTAMLIELVDPDNESLFKQKRGEIIISPILISNILANVALRPELNQVFDRLFYAEGPEISFVSAERIGLSGAVSFADITQAGFKCGMTVIGTADKVTGQHILNPGPKANFAEIDNYKIIVIF